MMILEALEAARVASMSSNIEIELINPTDAVLEIIQKHGGRIESTHWDTWCDSETCQHNSHSTGQEAVTVSVPEQWRAQARVASDTLDPAKLFVGIEDEYLALVIPDETPVGIFHCQSPHSIHFAPHTIAANAKVF